MKGGTQCPAFHLAVSEARRCDGWSCGRTNTRRQLRQPPRWLHPFRHPLIRLEPRRLARCPQRSPPTSFSNAHGDTLSRAHCDDDAYAPPSYISQHPTARNPHVRPPPLNADPVSIPVGQLPATPEPPRKEQPEDCEGKISCPTSSGTV